MGIRIKICGVTTAAQADALAYVANQGMVTPHVWLSRADRPRQPVRARRLRTG